jgi:hypothetical protein
VTDIDQFYPSIYTHAVPWALHTKTVAKASLKAPKGTPPLLGDQLDKALRVMNDGQTLGIPIGPDASFVIAEVLLAAADKELLSKLGGSLRGYRYVDDYELSFESLSSAEHALQHVQAALASLELQLNPRKTKIVDLPRELDSEWAVGLRTINIRGAKSPVGQRNDVISLFSRAFELASAFPSESVLRYAVSKVQGVSVASSGWRAFHNCVLGAAAADPSTLPVALGTLHQVAQNNQLVVPQAPLAEVFESVILRHGPRAQGSEVAWALWGALAWNVSLSSTAAKVIDVMEDDIVALLALHANAKGLFPQGALTATAWSALVAQPNVLESEHWLLAYEANQKGWLSTPAVKKHQAFGSMAKANVSFYNSAYAKPQFPLAGRSVPGGYTVG